MRPIEPFSRDELAHAIIVAGHFSGPTHTIAVKLLETAGPAYRGYRVIDPAGGAVISKFVCRYTNLIDALDKLAEVSGERLAVTGPNLIFMAVDDS